MPISRRPTPAARTVATEHFHDHRGQHGGLGAGNAGERHGNPDGSLRHCLHIPSSTQVVLSAIATATRTSPQVPQSIIFGTSELDITQNNQARISRSRPTFASLTARPPTGVPLAIVKAGAGALVLSGNNSYGGTTAINEGTLKIGSTTAIGSFNVGNNIVYSAVNIANKPGAKLDLSLFNSAVTAKNINIGNLSGGGGEQSLKSLPLWVSFIEHNGEHYGQLVGYFRLNGIVPPESRKK